MVVTLVVHPTEGSLESRIRLTPFAERTRIVMMKREVFM